MGYVFGKFSQNWQKPLQYNAIQHNANFLEQKKAFTEDKEFNPHRPFLYTNMAAVTSCENDFIRIVTRWPLTWQKSCRWGQNILLQDLLLLVLLYKFSDSWRKFLEHINSWTKYELVWVQALGSQAKYQRFWKTSVVSYYKHIHIVLVTNRATSENLPRSWKGEIKKS